jgi:protein AATF/BFR2
MSSLFSPNTLSVSEVSDSAVTRVNQYEKLLSLRISLQKLIEDGNKFPCKIHHAVEGQDNDITNLSTNLHICLRDLNDILVSQASANSDEKSSALAKKRKRQDAAVSTDRFVEWEDIISAQNNLKASWEVSINRWYSRLHYGSEKTQSKMRVFNRTLWEQVDEQLQDDVVCLQKSRALLGQSQRIDKPATQAPIDQVPVDEDHESGSDSDGNFEKQKGATQYDDEIYDDRAFYSLLLKAYITSGSTGAGMRADDLAQLRKYRKHKTDVDRRASKGRKLRYTVHKKLQNFMFPHEAPEPTLDVDRLLQSLFQ